MRTNWEMYTDAGNAAVTQAMDKINAIAAERTRVWNRSTLEAAAKPILQRVAKRHGEIYDTEPRGHIAEHLDGICKANGWAYDDWANYEW